MKYDFLIVGAGLFGAVFARKATDAGKKCLVIEKRTHVGGNTYCENINGITVHKYGAHIFHTDNEEVWNFVNKYCSFNDFVNSPIGVYKGERYNLPFNMNTFRQMWGVDTPEQAADIIASQSKVITWQPRNLEEQAISLVGTDIFEKLIKHYTEKQWGRPCAELPAFIIKRLPVRFTYDNNYFNDKYQGIPIGGYNVLIDALLDGCDIKLGVDYNELHEYYDLLADKVIYTGTVDAFFGYEFGHLEYRSLRFENEILPVKSFQGNAVVNYTDGDTPFTRIIEHKFFDDTNSASTVITREYPLSPAAHNEPFYPVNNDRNQSIYELYKNKVAGLRNVYFGGRLAEYAYYDMDKVIASAFKLAAELL